MYRIVLLLSLFLTGPALFAQSAPTWRQKIEQIATSRKAVVGVAIASADGRENFSLHGTRHFPLQSVFKFHIALAVLAEVDRGKLALTQPIPITKKDVSTELYSPIRDKYPEGTTLTLAEILEYTVSESDNVGCDLLLRMIGGPAAVQAYLTRLGFRDVSIKLDEETQQAVWERQFENWTTPLAANEVLARFLANREPLLSPASHAFLWKLMKETGTGPDRLPGRLPKEAVVAHKTGTSGKKDGTMAAVNDIGVVFLPNGGHFLISVFVTEAREDTATSERIIADIAKAAWDHFSGQGK